MFIQLIHKNRLSILDSQWCMELFLYIYFFYSVAELKMTGFNSVTVAGHISSSWPALKAIYCRAASGSAPAAPFKTAPLKTDSG